MDDIKKASSLYPLINHLKEELSESGEVDMSRFDIARRKWSNSAGKLDLEGLEIDKYYMKIVKSVQPIN
ncbi:hypothetical protein GTU79_16785 [Sodalis ligni]|uniref:hypothetical protein n=1 Tax=Sodalis ligni TaxID=2697027 RepID=UPI001BDF2990|nr:hypothetical protein [Sodalis ligni]QWA09123.1 hypothetical protein GTU79_16785 [Sodalis ligni]